MNLQKGANTLIGSKGQIEVIVSWTPTPMEIDISCFLTKADGKVLSDDYMIFYNQGVDPSRSVRFEQLSANQAKFTLQTDTIPTGIEKAVFASTIFSEGMFLNVQGLQLTARNSEGAEVTYQVTDATDERALVIAELYKHSSGWKLRAIGRGFNGGLKPLAIHHGVTVEDEDETQEAAATTEPVPVATPAPVVSPSPAAPPQPKPAMDQPVTRISLLKEKVKVTLEKKKIQHIKARVVAVLDASGSMTNLYKKGTVQRAFERTLAVASCMDDDGSMDVFIFGDKSMRAPSITENNFEGYIKRTYPAPKIWGGVGCGNNEPVVMRDVIKKYTIEEPNSNLPTLIFFFSDGGIYENSKIEKIMRECSNQPIFWQFIGIGNANYGVLERLDNLSGRFLDNADFFSLDDLDKISDEKLYDRMLNEFPKWIQQAKEKGVLR